MQALLDLSKPQTFSLRFFYYSSAFLLLRSGWTCESQGERIINRYVASVELVATILRPGDLAPNVHVTVENVILIGALFDNVARVDLDFENVMTAWHVGDVNPLFTC